MANDNDLRAALARCSPRERDVLRAQSADAAEKWARTLPTIAAVWAAFADLAADVERLDRARRAAAPNERLTVRTRGDRS